MATSMEDQVKSAVSVDSEMSVEENVTELPSAVNENIDSIPDLSEPLILPSTSGDNIEESSIESPVKAKSSVIDDKSDSIYQIKWISRNGCKSPIITQNENGPCPLIAITNVLIMKGRITVPSLADFVTTENLMAYLGDCILESIPKNIPEGTQLNFEQNMHDAMAVLPKLQTGLDVNVKFTGIGDFEYTPECIIFDLLRIPLHHGWLIDPQMIDVMAAVGKCSYNQLVEKIINSKCSSDPEKVTEALVAENFLEKTASQLTYHGLCELTSKLKEDELCVLFRNNHFSSLTKHKNCLYQLVTDQGFVNENAVWESLNNIEGDGQFVDADFIPVPPKTSDLTLPLELSKEKQIDQDEELARRLQEEELKREENHLQEQQLQQQQQQQQQQQGQTSQPSSPNSRNRSRDCVIL